MTALPVEYKNAGLAESSPRKNSHQEAPDSGARTELDAGSRLHELSGSEYHHEVSTDRR